ncbi:hypothetical protein QKU48_gp1404 [Fadolivirus algeromassiliense]|jgi:hypothetical protein|uniref:Uncharacterized protein n=1 Tax=Fadolivirus FV1/VV64 TaxID=3070911 RepID=A0A7D3R1X3_9VIRU|nr:hypothetical protein QKU48_gp1404 [Fadolivirus algeromassiliense]QKF94862.1 hypothetical protein Fadolivirus_1_1404 [Fadolivirus FV1/VV64]
MGLLKSKHRKASQSKRKPTTITKEQERFNSLVDTWAKEFQNINPEFNYKPYINSLEKIYDAISSKALDGILSKVKKNDYSCNIIIGTTIHLQEIYYKSFAIFVLNNILRFTKGMNFITTSTNRAISWDLDGDAREYTNEITLTMSWDHIEIKKEDVESFLITRKVKSWKKLLTIQDMVIFQYLHELKKYWTLCDMRKVYMELTGDINAYYTEPIFNYGMASYDDILENYNKTDDLKKRLHRFVDMCVSFNDTAQSPTLCT